MKRTIAEFKGDAKQFKSRDMKLRGLGMWVTVSSVGDRQQVMLGAPTKRGLVRAWKEFALNRPNQKMFQRVIVFQDRVVGAR